MTNIKKFVRFWAIALVANLYITFVIENLWNWFAVPAFHTSDISFWGMYGLVLIVGLLADRQGENFTESQMFKYLAAAIDACVPENKRQEVADQLKEQEQNMWHEIGMLIFGRFIGGSLALGLGFAVHAFLM